MGIGGTRNDDKARNSLLFQLSWIRNARDDRALILFKCPQRVSLRLWFYSFSSPQKIYIDCLEAWDPFGTNPRRHLLLLLINCVWYWWMILCLIRFVGWNYGNLTRLPYMRGTLSIKVNFSNAILRLQMKKRLLLKDKFNKSLNGEEGKLSYLYFYCYLQPLQALMNSHFIHTNRKLFFSASKCRRLIFTNEAIHKTLSRERCEWGVTKRHR